MSLAEAPALPQTQPRITVRPVTRKGDFAQIQLLRDAIYVQTEHRIGAVDDFAGSFDRYNERSLWFIALVDEQVVGTVKVIGDSEIGLPFESIIGRQHRGAGDVVVEIGHLLALPGSSTRYIVMDLLREASAYSRNELGATHLVGDVFLDKTRGDAFYRRVGFKPLHGPYRDERFLNAPMSMMLKLRMADVAPLMRGSTGTRKELLRYLTSGWNDPEIRRAAAGLPQKASSSRTPGERRLQELAAKRMKLSTPSHSRASLIMGCGVQEKADGCYIQDQEGRRFLDLFDAYGNQAFGYGHPRILAALRRQLDSGHTNTGKIFFDEMPIRLSEALAGLTDNALPCSFLTNGGAEAIEHALKLARAHTRRPKFITAANAYHGKTFAALSAACRPEYEEMFRPLMPEFQSVPFGDIAALEQAIDDRTAAVLIETVQTEGGIVVPSDAYLRRLRELCTERGALLILDEIQVGFGRTGRFFAYEHAGILPDVICIGKSFGGGMMASAAILAREEFWTPFRIEPLSFGSSLGGNPLSSAVGLEAIDIANDPEFLRDVRAKGELVGRRLARLAKTYPDLIRSTRGVGLLHGMTLVDPAVTGLLLRQLYERGVITTFCLFDASVVRVEPPLIITEEQLDGALCALESAFAETSRYVGGLPAGALGSSSFEAIAEIPVPPDALFESLCDPDYLYGNSPVVTAYTAAGPGRFACEGRIDDIPIEWEDTVSIAPGRREVEQRAASGFWQGFTRRWTVQPLPGASGAKLMFRIEWDVGTGGFERVLSLRLRYSLEKAVARALSGLRG